MSVLNVDSVKLGKIWRSMSLTKIERTNEAGIQSRPAGRMSISATGLVTYSICPRKFKWQREDNWEYDGPKKANAMCLGSMVHYLLEMGIPYMFPDEGGGPATASHNCSKELDSCIAEYTDNEMVQTAIYTDIVPYAKFMATQTFNWFDQEKFFDRYDIVSMEKDYVWEIAPQWELRCRPDLIVRDRVTGTLGIIDFKTGTSVDQAPMNSDWQMRTMAVVIENLLGESVGFGGHLRIKKIKTTKGKPPYVQLNEMRFDKERVELAENEIMQMLIRMGHDVIHLPNPTWTCASMCSFYDACEAKSANQDWEYVIAIDHKKGIDE